MYYKKCFYMTEKKAVHMKGITRKLVFCFLALILWSRSKHNLCLFVFLFYLVYFCLENFYVQLCIFLHLSFQFCTNRLDCTYQFAASFSLNLCWIFSHHTSTVNLSHSFFFLMVHTTSIYTDPYRYMVIQFLFLDV